MYRSRTCASAALPSSKLQKEEEVLEVADPALVLLVLSLPLPLPLPLSLFLRPALPSLDLFPFHPFTLVWLACLFPPKRDLTFVKLRRWFDPGK